MNHLERKSCSAEASTIFVIHLHCTTSELAEIILSEMALQFTGKSFRSSPVIIFYQLIYKISFAIWHATECHLEISWSFGTPFLQASVAYGQRVSKRQPSGIFIGLGSSPLSWILLCAKTSFLFSTIISFSKYSQTEYNRRAYGFPQTVRLSPFTIIYPFLIRNTYCFIISFFSFLKNLLSANFLFCEYKSASIS